MSCKYCREAFVDLYEQDVDSKLLINSYIKSNVFSLRFDVGVDSDGCLALFASDGCNYIKIGKRKIKYCPICGKPIPSNTPSQARKATNGNG